jgi:hypothetical protein
LNIATWNVRGLEIKEIELDKEIKGKKIHIAIITKNKEEEAKKP